MAEVGKNGPASTKELVLQAGIELLEREGLSLTFDSISYAKVFQYLSDEYQVTVTRGSVHERIWASQDDFRRDVLAESVAFFSANAVSDAIIDSAEGSDNPDRFLRSLGCRAFLPTMQAPMFERYQSVKALACWFDDPLATDTLHRLLDDRAELILAGARARLPETFVALGLRPKKAHGLTAEQAAEIWSVLAAGMMEGAQINYHAGSHDLIAAIDFMGVPADSDDPWRALSIGVKAVLDFLYEPDPDPVELPNLNRTVPSGPIRLLSQPVQPKIASTVSDEESKSSRRPRAQLRELVLTAAVELLLRDGPQLQPDLLSYSTVFAFLKESRGITVNRSSVHPRVWASNEDYRLEVLAKSLEINKHPIRSFSKVLESVKRVRRPDGTIDRPRSMAEIFRTGGASVARVSAESAAYRRLLQVKAALVDKRDTKATALLRNAVAEVERQRVVGNNVELRELVIDIGFRVRPDIGLSDHDAIHLFQSLSMTAAAGVLYNDQAGITAATRPVVLATAGEGAVPLEWSPLGIGMRSFFELLYEEVP